MDPTAEWRHPLIFHKPIYPLASEEFGYKRLRRHERAGTSTFSVPTSLYINVDKRNFHVEVNRIRSSCEGLAN